MSTSCASLPVSVEELCLTHDEVCDRVRLSCKSIESELSQPSDRNERRELAASIVDIEFELRSLFRKKFDVGYFDGFENASDRCRERIAHLKSDYRRLLNELRQIEKEIVSGKPRKAERQLNHWLTRFADVLDREFDLLDEIWSFEPLAS